MRRICAHCQFIRGENNDSLDFLHLPNPGHVGRDLVEFCGFFLEIKHLDGVARMIRANFVHARPRHGYLEDGEFGSDIPFAACRDVTRMLIVQSIHASRKFNLIVH